MLKNTTKLSDELRGRINEALKPLSPEKVIVFGSYAWGQPTQDSDIDLVVVLDSTDLPKTYNDKRMNRLRVRKALESLNQEYALDLLVYTIPEWQQFQNQGSSFSKEIASSGVDI